MISPIVFLVVNNPTKNQMKKIAIYIEGGIIQAIRSNIGEDLDIELVDADNEPDEAEDRWEELQNELEFGNL
jgi:hypothetical protein